MVLKKYRGAERKKKQVIINGLFVINTYKAPSKMPNLYIDGKDVYLRWHQISDEHQVYFNAGIQLVLALANTEKNNEFSLSTKELETAIDGIVKQISNLENIEKSCSTIERANENARSEAIKIRKELLIAIQNLETFSIDAKGIN